MSNDSNQTTPSISNEIQSTKPIKLLSDTLNLLTEKIDVLSTTTDFKLVDDLFEKIKTDSVNLATQLEDAVKVYPELFNHLEPSVESVRAKLSSPGDKDFVEFEFMEFKEDIAKLKKNIDNIHIITKNIDKLIEFSQKNRLSPGDVKEINSITATIILSIAPLYKNPALAYAVTKNITDQLFKKHGLSLKLNNEPIQDQSLITCKTVVA